MKAEERNINSDSSKLFTLTPRVIYKAASYKQKKIELEMLDGVKVKICFAPSKERMKRPIVVGYCRIRTVLFTVLCRILHLHIFSGFPSSLTTICKLQPSTAIEEPSDSI